MWGTPPLPAIELSLEKSLVHGCPCSGLWFGLCACPSSGSLSLGSLGSWELQDQAVELPWVGSTCSPPSAFWDSQTRPPMLCPEAGLCNSLAWPGRTGLSILFCTPIVSSSPFPHGAVVGRLPQAAGLKSDPCYSPTN